MRANLQKSDIPEGLTVQRLRAASRVIQQLDSSVQRTKILHSRARRGERKSFQAQISLFVPDHQSDLPPSSITPRCIPAWSYNLSQGGMGLIALDGTLAGEIWMGAPLPNGEIRWLKGTIVRRRPIPEEAFVDYGIRFNRNTADSDGQAID